MKFTPLPTLITCGNLSAGFLAVLLAFQGRFFQTAALVLVAAGLDLLDGAVARGSASDGEFGGNLDSLADLVSFGVAPAIALYMSSLHALPVAGVAVCLFYVVCGALRLARFPLVKNREHFVGLPIPPAGVVLAGLAALGLSWPLVLVVVIAFSVLIIGETIFPKPSSLPLPKRVRDEKHPSTEEL